MTEQSAGCRRLWKRSAIACVTLLLVPAVWLVWTNDDVDKNAQAVELGQSFFEVRAIMGQRDGLVLGGRGRKTLLYGRWQTFRFQLHMFLPQNRGKPYDYAYKTWPVEIRFDENDRVKSIRRGTVIIEAPKQ
jgi:hypothetical protein